MTSDEIGALIELISEGIRSPDTDEEARLHLGEANRNMAWAEAAAYGREFRARISE